MEVSFGVLKHLFKSLKLFSTCLLSSFSAVQAIAFASINKQLVKADKLFHLHNTFT